MTLRDLFSSAEIAACFSDDALIGGMLAFERALARAEGACGAIPASAAARIDEAGQQREVRRRYAGDRGATRRHARDPVRQAPDGAGRASRRRGVALRALGRDQPGRARYRAGALRKAGIATTARAVGSTRRCSWPAWPMRIARHRRSRARCCNLRRRCRSVSRPPCGWTRSRGREWRCDARPARVQCCNSVARAGCSRHSVRWVRKWRHNSLASSISRRQPRRGTVCGIRSRDSAPKLASRAK